MTASTVLVIEDEPGLQRTLRDRLVANGFRTVIAGDARSGVQLWRNEHPALVLLDVMLPDADGIRLLKEMRLAGYTTPVIMLTARGETTDKIVALGLGADDYVTKPFDLGELVARIEAQIRRAQGLPVSRDERRIRIGPWRLELEGERVAGPDGYLDLSTTEYRLLAYLAQHRNRTVSREELLREVWHYAPDAASRTVDQHIAQLRAKIEVDRSRPRYLLTVHQQGYRLQVH